MDPLSVISSISGIITAATQVVTLLSQIKDAPTLIKTVMTEVNHIGIVFRALRRFLDRAAKLPGGHVVLIQIDDVVVILTQTVLVFSELETVIIPLSD
jgi:hypothetical protein